MPSPIRPISLVTKSMDDAATLIGRVETVSDAFRMVAAIDALRDEVGRLRGDSVQGDASLES